MKKKLKAPKLKTGSKRTPSLKASTSLTETPSKWIRIDVPFPLPVYVREALQKLDDEEHLAYIVGGSVRDFLLSRATQDHDIATSATPDQIVKIFPNSIEVGKAFGVLKIPIAGVAKPLEIATFREDLEYKDHRHPKGVKLSGPSEDARRRDFTVNALFYDPKTRRILDTTQGMEDLRAKKIRAIGEPSERFREDALRLLRAVRFTTTLGFEVDEATAAAVKAHSKLISKVSFERIRDEVSSMLMGPHPGAALDLLSKMGLLKIILPELEAMRGVKSPLRYEGDVWKHALKILDTFAQQNPQRSLVVAWAAALHNVGKPLAAAASDGKNFNSHEIEAARIALSVGDRMKLARAETDRIIAVVGDQLRFRDVFKMREATLQRWIREPFFEESLAVHRAEAVASDGNLAFYEFAESRFREMKSTQAGTPKLIDGNDLIQLGFPPGKGFSEILKGVEDLALEGKIRSKDEALEFVVKNFVK